MLTTFRLRPEAGVSSLLVAVLGMGAIPADAQAPAAEAEPRVPAAILPLDSVVARLCLSPDGAHLYALDISEGRLLKIATDNLRVVLQADVGEGAVAMSLSADGSTVWVAARQDPLPSSERDAKPSGVIQVFATENLKVSGTLSVGFAPVDIAAGDRGIGYVMGDGLHVVNPGKKGVEESSVGGDLVRLHPDKLRLYTTSEGRGEGFSCMILKKDRRWLGYGMYSSPIVLPPGERRVKGGLFEISGDGRYLLSSRGMVVLLKRPPDFNDVIGRDQKIDMLAGHDIEPFTAAWMPAGSSVCFVATPDGHIKEFVAATGAPGRAFRTDRLCTHLVGDAKRHVLYAAACPISPHASPQSWKPGERAFGVGDLVAFTLSQGGKANAPQGK